VHGDPPEGARRTHGGHGRRDRREARTTNYLQAIEIPPPIVN
jgi:hypothetical protein